MLAFLKGTLYSKMEDTAIVEVNGVAFEIKIGSKTASNLPQEGSIVLLHTHLAVKEDDLQLYGFLQRQELQLFRMLLGVSGIGPRSALAFTDFLPENELLKALAEERIGLLTKVPGVGKKTAQRLILELKEKAARMTVVDKYETLGDGAGSEWDEAFEGMTALGYSVEEATDYLREAEKHMDSKATAQKLLQIALKEAGNRRKS